MQIQVPSDWDTAKLVDSIEVMCAQYTSDMPVKITSFSTEDVEILAEIWKLIMTKAGSLQKEIRRFIHELVTLSGIRAQNEQLDIKIIMDEEETKRGKREIDGLLLLNTIMFYNETSYKDFFILCLTILQLIPYPSCGSI